MDPVDISLERAIIQDSQAGTEQLLVAGNLGILAGGIIVLLSVGSS